VTAARATAAPPDKAAPPDRRPSLDRERRLWKEGHAVVAGLDEVGRGAWAGPVSVGVAVVRTGCRRNGLPRWLRDSKLLPEARREDIFDAVARWCADWSVGHASAAECDLFGMTAALRLASYRALAGLGVRPDALILDGPLNYLAERPLREWPGEPSPALPLEWAEVDGGPSDEGWPARDGPPPELPLPEVDPPGIVVPVVDADALCASVSAASVLAKVVRDRHMRAEAEHFPPYAFELNKGYPSPVHKTALRGYGLSAIHRRSWAFVEGLPWR